MGIETHRFLWYNKIMENKKFCFCPEGQILYNEYYESYIRFRDDAATQEAHKEREANDWLEPLTKLEAENILATKAFKEHRNDCDQCRDLL